MLSIFGDNDGHKGKHAVSEVEVDSMICSSCLSTYMYITKHSPSQIVNNDVVSNQSILF